MESQPRDVPAQAEAETHHVATPEQRVLDLGELSGVVGDPTGQREQAREKIRSQRKSARQAAIDRSGAAPGAHYFGWLYLAAWAVGTFPLFADPNHRLWFVPWIVMLAYGLLGHAKAEQTGTMFEFADSVYYLGFTLSVGALLASLDPFNPNVRPDAEKIFRLFGQALITTLFGVVGRTALQTFYRLPTETIEEVNQRLTAEARRYVEQLSELTTSMDRILTTQVRSTETQLVPQFATLENVLRMTVTDLTVVSGGAQVLKETVKEATSALGVMMGQYQARSRDITTSHDSMVNSAKQLSSAFSGASDLTVASVSQFSDAVEILDQQAKSVSSALERVATSLSSVTVDPTPLAGPIAAIGEAVREVGDATRAEATGLKAATKALLEEVERVQSAHSDLTRRDFTAALDRFAKQLDALSDATANQRTLTEGEVEMLQKQVTTTLAAARDVSAALEEITTIVLARLKELTGATRG